jgi:predicted phage terminase large subunit-like protein
MTSKEAKIIKVHKGLVLSSLLCFTRYFFKKNNRRKFIIGEHHQLICNALDKVSQGKIKRLIINIAPRYGKTEVAVKNFIAYGLALNPSAKFIHLSYANELALDNSEGVKDLIKSDAYRELFPKVQVKQRTDSKKKWYTTADGGVYATAAGGQVTGFGAGKVDEDEDLDDFFTKTNDPENFNGALIIDDPIKPEDADSTLIREKVNKRFDSTIRNRVNSRNTPIIIIMQRLHENDLCGYLLQNEPGQWTVLSLPCIKPDNSALWEFKHTLAELQKMETENPIVFARQYQQKADSITGKLYKRFKTYKDAPAYLPSIKAVVDTADEGSDFLCSIVYSPTKTGIYLLDVYYTQAGMEVTEPKTAAQMKAFHVQDCRVESNAGGRSFARNIERISRENQNYQTAFTWFHQSKNKQSRIFSQSAEVQNMIYYPEDWEVRWPLFAKAIKSYLSEGNNAHDDAADALTMIVEAQKLGNYKIVLT